jgi:hypothetical protein
MRPMKRMDRMAQQNMYTNVGTVIWSGCPAEQWLLKSNAKGDRDLRAQAGINVDEWHTVDIRPIDGREEMPAFIAAVSLFSCNQ